MKAIHKAMALVALVATPVATQFVCIGTAAAQTVPSVTQIQVTPMQEITSKKVEVGETYKFQVVADVVENGTVAIPRGAPVTGEIV